MTGLTRSRFTGAILPKPYQDALLGIFDAAPQISYDSVCAVMRSEFGALSPDDLFDDFEQTPVASASIAQVHRAKLKGTQRQVAVKVRKPAIPKQVNWDLRAYKYVVNRARWRVTLTTATGRSCGHMRRCALVL